MLEDYQNSFDEDDVDHNLIVQIIKHIHKQVTYNGILYVQEVSKFLCFSRYIEVDKTFGQTVCTVWFWMKRLGPWFDVFYNDKRL